MANPLTAEMALSLVRRWSVLDKYPFHSEGEGRLAKALFKHSHSFEHAQLIVDHFTEMCPRPRDIEDAARVLGPRKETDTEKMWREFEEAVRRAILEGRTEDVDYYTRCQPEMVARVRRKMAKGAHA